jgi:hypothetical protein
MQDGKFIFYTNRDTDVSVFTFYAPDGTELTIKSKELEKEKDGKNFGIKMSGHHVMIRALFEKLGEIESGTESEQLDEMLRMPFMVANGIIPPDDNEA